MFREDDVRGCLPPEVDRRVTKLDVHRRVDSTNSYLASTDAPPPGHWHAVIADEQTAGRGRGGNRWESAPGAGLWLSAAYTFEAVPSQLSSLTIALGVGLADELETLGATGIRLKWPNDFVVNDRKLGGLLVETAGSNRTVVCGVGINYVAPDAERFDADEALTPIGLREAMRDVPSRPELAARIIARAADILPNFAVHGLAPWHAQWSDYDWLLGQQVRVTDVDPELTGIARGIGNDGALLIHDGLVESRIVSGSIRRSADDA